MSEYDISVDFQLIATCPVCPEGQDDMCVMDSETIACEMCGSYWDMHGDYQGNSDD